MPKVYAFDVDECLETSNGPVTVQMLKDLHEAGHIVGVCGNLSAFLPKVPDWHRFISFTLNLDFGWNGIYGPQVGCYPKALWLHCFQHVTLKGQAEEFVMVGNQFGRVNGLGVKCGSHDDIAAREAGWRFLLEDSFAAGER